jgi:small GTP-binding protein
MNSLNNESIEKQPKYMLKICLLGQSGVGKTSLVHRLCFDRFDANIKLTIGLDFYTFDILELIDNEESIIRLSIWDFGAQERFKQLIPHYLIGLNGLFLIFDLSNQESLNNLDWWYRNLVKYKLADNPKILIGTKLDLVQKNLKTDSNFLMKIEEKKLKCGIETYINTSSKENINILFSFEKLVRSILKNMAIEQTYI